jgi:hypothetical protein
MRILTAFLVLLPSVAALAGEIHAPAPVMAGTSTTIQTSGSGDATFYLIGPASATKSKVEAGSNVNLDAEQLEHAGRYTAVLCASDGCNSTAFYVNPAAANKLSLLVHPSRVPVASPNAISTVAFTFDNFHNLVLNPEPVKFSVLPQGGQEVSADREAKDGVAWVRLTSARKEGTTRLGASIGHASEIRVVQQVAADACNLRIKASKVKSSYLIETDPVRDCAGNPVPDGTVVSFTMTDAAGKTTVDVPIKRGVARVEIPVKGRAKVTVASGVVTGNELEVSGG